MARDTFGQMRSRGAMWFAVTFSMSALAYETSEARRYFEQARQLFEQRQWDEAQSAAAKAVAADPQMSNAEILLGLIASARSQFGEAEKHFVRAVVLEPRNHQAHGYLGSTYLQEKQLTKAAASFQKVLELSPGNVTANYNLGLIALAQDLPSDALRRFELVTRASPTDVPALIGTLECQLILRKNGDARQTTRRLETLLDNRDPRLFQVATLLAQHQESIAAIALMERARAAFPQSYDVSYNLALAYLQTSQYSRAAEVLQTLTGAQGKSEAFDLLGTIEEKRANPDNAERAFEEAARREPSNEDYRFNYGNSLVQHGKLDRAVGVFRPAVLDLPKSWKLRIGLGTACYLLGDYNTAAEELLEAVRLKPDSAPVYFLLGEAYDSAEHFQQAIENAFKTYLKTSPRDSWAYYHYAAILYGHAQAAGSGDYQAAVANLNEALRLNANFAEAYLELGLVALAQDKVEQGIAVLEKAVSLDPRLAAAHYRLGLAYRRMNNTAKAKVEMDRFRALKDEARYGGRVRESLASMAR